MNQTVKVPLTDAIVTLLTERGALKAKEIAALLAVDSAEVNRALYGPLTGRVTQDRAYRWAMSRNGTGRGQTESAAGPTSALARLCRYYLDCLAHDAEQGCSVFASSFTASYDYAALGQLPELRARGTWAASMESEAQALVQRSRRDRSAVLYVGYPTLLRYHRTAKWEGYFVEPLLLYTLDTGDNGILQVTDDVPTLNFKAIKSLGDGGNVLDDVVALSEELGLVTDDEPPSLDEIAYRLQAVRPDWPWIDAPDLARRKVEPPIASLSGPGIYNYAVVVLGERPSYTQGLETELKSLSLVPDEKLKDTALGRWVSGEENGNATALDEALIEVVGLNSEQRAAVHSSLNSPLTVITGPPGTGKSQVVTALLANCAWRGQKVLFASKNNKAVDVVEQRINGLSSRPTLIRLGSRQYEARLAEFLVGLLSATTAPEDQSEYEVALANQRRLAAELALLESSAQKIVDARNTVDGLEGNLEKWREVFGATLGHLKNVDTRVLGQHVEPLKRAVIRADASHSGLFERLIWFLIRSGRFRDFQVAATNPTAISAVEMLNLRMPDLAGDASVSRFMDLLKSIDERLAGVESVQKYLAALEALTGQRPLEDIARQYTAVEDLLGENALGLWQAWARLQPSRLSRNDRQALARYHTLLEVVLDSTRGGGQIPSQAWRQYKELVPKISHLIPCWAVTSLSAHGKVPFEPGMFDLLVIDEASQCDIASALPLLYRTKRVVVIGDPKQLAHISKLSPRQDSQIQQKHGIPVERTEWAYSVNSLYALASTIASAENFVSLRDHHRSHADIIEFSNRQFYDKRLRVATAYDRLKRVEPTGPAVRWFHVEGQVHRPPGGSVRNDVEAHSILKLLRRLVFEQQYEGTIGVVSPYRAQCNRIRDLVVADAPLSDRLARLEFIAETAHQFQGDERDIIVFSPVVSQGIAQGSLGFLRSNGNLFNVAITRARAALYVVGDKLAARESGVDYLAAFAKYADEVQHKVQRETEIGRDIILGPEYPSVARPDRVSEWERVLYRALYAAGVRAIPQFSIERFVLDFALIDGDRRLNVEVDGERYHRAWDGELVRRDRLRNQRMIELGWDVKRFWVYQVRDQLERCVADIQEWLDKGRS